MVLSDNPKDQAKIILFGGIVLLLFGLYKYFTDSSRLLLIIGITLTAVGFAAIQGKWTTNPHILNKITWPELLIVTVVLTFAASIYILSGNYFYNKGEYGKGIISGILIFIIGGIITFFVYNKLKDKIKTDKAPTLIDYFLYLAIPYGFLLLMALLATLLKI